MLDIRLIRERPEFVRERLATRGSELAQEVDKVLGIDSERRRLETQLQQLNADRNKLSKQIGILRSKKEVALRRKRRSGR
jgi:seryl-tRNA synthetase